MVRVGVLGPIEVDGGAPLEPRDRTVVAVLVVRRSQVVSSAQIADAVWGESPPASWPKQVQICIGRARRALGAGAIETVGGGYRLALPDDDIDAGRFEQLVDQARTLAVSGEPDRAAAALGRALALWRGTPLEALDCWQPARSESARLEELRRCAEEDWLEVRLAAGEHRQVAAEAEALASAEPLRERRWMSLALAQYRCERQGDALRSLAAARRVLVEQLGVAPGPQLVELEAAILRQDVALSAVPEPATVSAECPYRGLAPFGETDADAFFGRDAETAACLARLHRHPLLVVAGPSGCGKSSLVRAGIAATLRRQGREVDVLVPGDEPSLAANQIAAAVDVVVVDQFEELYAAGPRHEATEAVHQALVAHADAGGLVVLAIRSDGLGALSGDAALSRLAEQGLHLLAPLAGDQLRLAIEEPATLAGIRLEPGLVELLVRECEGEPGGLPLLSHALVETWRRRDGATMSVEGYRASGGIQGAVARSADRLHDALSIADRGVLRSVLLRLVAVSPEGEPVRTRVPSRNLVGRPETDHVVGLLVRARLVTAQEDTFEVAHDALARAWPRLRAWLDEDVAGQRILRHLGEAADGWDTLGRPDAELYRGARLETALEWREQVDPLLTEVEQSFIDRSEAQAGSERRALQQRAAEDAATTRRLRRRLVLSAVLVVAALVAGVTAAVQANRADSQRELAAARALAAAAVAEVDIDPERGALLALAALEQTGPDGGAVRTEIEQALHDAISALRVERHLPGGGWTADWSADGRRVLTAGRGTADATAIDVATGRVVASFAAGGHGANDLEDSPDGRMVALARRDGVVSLLDAATGGEVHTVRGEGPAGQLAFSPDGRSLAAVWRADGGGVVRVVDVADGSVRGQMAWPGAFAVAFSPDGSALAVVSGSSGAVLDVATGRQLASLMSELGRFTSVAWSPDGGLIAVGQQTGSAQLHDAVTGELAMMVPGHGSEVLGVAWHPDSQRLATASADGTAKVWWIYEGGARPLLSLTAADVRSGFSAVAFSPDGSRLVTSGRGGTAVVWRTDLGATAEVASLPGVVMGAGAVRFLADGHRLAATGGGGGGIALWETSGWRASRWIGSGAPPAPGVLNLWTPRDVEVLAPSPDGGLVAAIRAEVVGGAGGVVVVSGVRTSDRGFTIDLGRQAVDAAWSSDGQLLAVGGVARDGEGVVQLADRRGVLVGSVRFPDRVVHSARLIADGRLVVAHSGRGAYEPGSGRVDV